MGLLDAPLCLGGEEMEGFKLDAGWDNQHGYEHDLYARPGMAQRLPMVSQDANIPMFCLTKPNEKLICSHEMRDQ